MESLMQCQWLSTIEEGLETCSRQVLHNNRSLSLMLSPGISKGERLVSDAQSSHCDELRSFNSLIDAMKTTCSKKESAVKTGIQVNQSG